MFFNLISILQNNNDKEKATIKFNFYNFKSQNWDLEHIHLQKDDINKINDEIIEKYGKNIFEKYKKHKNIDTENETDKKEFINHLYDNNLNEEYRDYFKNIKETLKDYLGV